MNLQILKAPPLAGRHAAIALVCLVLFFGTTACTIRLIGDYDDVIDKGLTDFQVKVESFLTGLESGAGTPQAEYKPDFYDVADATISSLRSRAKASFKKDILSEQLDNLRKSMNDLRDLHKSFGAKISRQSVETARSTLEVSIESILHLELALKRGKTAGLVPPPPMRTGEGE